MRQFSPRCTTRGHSILLPMSTEYQTQSARSKPVDVGQLLPMRVDSCDYVARVGADVTMASLGGVEKCHRRTLPALDTSNGAASAIPMEPSLSEASLDIKGYSGYSARCSEKLCCIQSRHVADRVSMDG